MKWSEICIHTTQEAVEPVSNILHEAGASGVVIEDPDELFKERESIFGEVYDLSADDYPEEGVMLKAYLPVNSFLAEAVEEIKEAINQLLLYDIDLGHNKVTLSEVNEEEWSTAWKKYYKPVKVSDHITITPTWEDYQPVGDEEIVIELDPGMAFGTGTHPTTVLCIQALERHLYDGASVVDVGTGTGVLSIAAAKLGAAKVHALDLDEVAVKSAKLNVKLNKVQETVDVTQDNLLDNPAIIPDVIVANILAEVIVQMTDEAFQSLKASGTFIMSGIIQTKRDMVKDALQSAGFVIKEIIEMEDWLAFVASKPE
ncbi:50S ribosomal protein L11 methyltransferase [Salipaludibacillus sp. LMS25]|jgi:ribosomal protein L11 methyltransferase|uniref:50S ribosomal protein L11 methyltransferase n=1 Tax=Salipaludibacillus sp. LMS25 TaxID=2924031 RepID=UPI0020D109A2|nr:50S ribosomal protein L11 methyltransferase [Salipaludibacillus sp. LMS25]UTR14365.1 50S ribosomal protein L11 methyltransferase [Salipaludibacillus sp. LMS25]